MVLTGTDARAVRPYKGLHVSSLHARFVRPLHQKLQHRSFNGNGRTSRASLQQATREMCGVEDVDGLYNTEA